MIEFPATHRTCPVHEIQAGINVISGSYKRSLFLGSLLLLAVFYILSTQPRMKQFKGKTMGTTYHVSYVTTLFSNPVDDISKKVYDALHDVDLRMSTYREDSELMRFNRAPLNEPVKLSSDIVSLVKESQRISVMSNGAYDVTVGPLVNLWGFGPSSHDPKAKSGAKEHSGSDKKTIKAPEFVEWMLKNYPGEVPSQASIEKARERVGYQYVIADSANSTLTRNKPVFVDLSSIAKGYGVDQAAKALREAGIDNFMVEVGGEVLVSGNKPDGSLWRLGVRGPNMAGGEPRAIVTPGNKALATSGDYLNFFEIDGQRYSHSINPATGHPEANRLAEVAVISDTVAEADALATMFMVLGDEKGLELANREGIAAYFTYHSSKGFESISSQAFKPYLVN